MLSRRQYLSDPVQIAIRNKRLTLEEIDKKIKHVAPIKIPAGRWKLNLRNSRTRSKNSNSSMRNTSKIYLIPGVTQELINTYVKNDMSWVGNYIYVIPKLENIKEALKRKGKKICKHIKRGDECVCSKSVETNYIFLPPDPFQLDIKTYPKIPSLLFKGIKFIFWVPDLYFNQYVRHLYCPFCQDRLIINCWNPRGPRFINASPQEYAVLTKVFYVLTISNTNVTIQIVRIMVMLE